MGHQLDGSWTRQHNLSSLRPPGTMPLRLQNQPAEWVSYQSRMLAALLLTPTLSFEKPEAAIGGSIPALHAKPSCAKFEPVRAHSLRVGLSEAGVGRYLVSSAWFAETDPNTAISGFLGRWALRTGGRAKSRRGDGQLGG